MGGGRGEGEAEQWGGGPERQTAESDSTDDSGVNVREEINYLEG